MKFDANIELDAKKARTYLENLIKEGSRFEIVKKNKQRTIKQNAYLHVCITLYGIHFGLSIAEAKTDLKRDCPYHDFTRYQKNGRLYLASTSNYTTDQAGMFIDWLRTYAGKNGCYIPTSEEYLENKWSIDKDIERNKEFL